MGEPFIEPENRTECPNTLCGHIWIWESDKDDYYCDECGGYESQQES